jgi:hypothetical protein
MKELIAFVVVSICIVLIVATIIVRGKRLFDE